MQTQHLQELIDLEESYWWHVAKRELVIGLLQKHFPAPARLIEGGIGSSRNLLAFRELGYQVHGLDVMPEAVSFAAERDVPATLHDLQQPWPVEPESMDVAVLLDVIEHVAEPVTVLKNAAAALVSGGGVIVTVPAYQWMFGDWDRALGHYRRYTARMLRHQATEAGMTIRSLTHWNAFTLPAAMVVRGVQKLGPAQRQAEFPRVSPVTNRLLQRCAGVERWVMRRMPIPCGLSVVGVLTK